MQEKEKPPCFKLNMMFLLFIVMAIVNFIILSHDDKQAPVLLTPVASMAKEAGH